MTCDECPRDRTEPHEPLDSVRATRNAAQKRAEKLARQVHRYDLGIQRVSASLREYVRAFRAAQKRIAQLMSEPANAEWARLEAANEALKYAARKERQRADKAEATTEYLKVQAKAVLNGWYIEWRRGSSVPQEGFYSDVARAGMLAKSLGLWDGAPYEPAWKRGGEES